MDCFLNGHRFFTDLSSAPKSGVVRSNYFVIVRQRHLRISGPSEACGIIAELGIRKLTPPVADSSCWDRAFDYHYCCTIPKQGHSVPPSCFTGQHTFERCCRTPKKSPSLHRTLALHTSEILPRRACLAAPYCQRTCLGARPEAYETLPARIAEMPYPAPLVCNGVSIHPLSYAIPAELVVDCIPPKSSDFALIWPGHYATYIFKDSNMDPRTKILASYSMSRE
eukprot:TRINITY_DN94961_c0_g1_i1.p1 TRINITY_DN94961_c0_g1~~TRINITY_DN94961_c0_g1_i1.p1  ORF type:complete len:224 (+),score=9.96 TRINITY_DN94961_c0_g1_i1:485-1156(+)